MFTGTMKDAGLSDFCSYILSRCKPCTHYRDKQNNPRTKGNYLHVGLSEYLIPLFVYSATLRTTETKQVKTEEFTKLQRAAASY